MKKQDKEPGVNRTIFILLLVALVSFKVCGVIDLPWFWVLGPITIPLVIMAGLIFMVGLVVVIEESNKKD